jgi:hypothetical protein
MSPAELRNLELTSLQRPVSGGNRRLQDEEVASASSVFQSSGSSIRGSRRYSRLCNCWVFQLPLLRVKTISTISYYAHHAKMAAFCRPDGSLFIVVKVRQPSRLGEFVARTCSWKHKPHSFRRPQ